MDTNPAKGFVEKRASGRAPRVVVIGGGAAGFFAAATAARLGAEVALWEKSSSFLAKVRISGGGRCNVTHACFDPTVLASHYPRGEREVRRLFHRFGPQETVAWFAARGVQLKTEPDGRMFPTTDHSSSIIDALVAEARRHGVRLCLERAVRHLHPPLGQLEHPCAWEVEDAYGKRESCDRVLVATGGWKRPHFLEALGIDPTPLAPSLFALDVPDSHWLRELPGLSLDEVGLRVPETKLSAAGPLLLTHRGLSGPAVLRLSAWGAREFAARKYRFSLRLNLWPSAGDEGVRAWMAENRLRYPGRKISSTPPPSWPQRLWERLLCEPGAPAPEIRWTTLSRSARHWLAEHILRLEIPVIGKSTHKEEFVTCGGVNCKDVDFATMESRQHRGLFFAGEVLDIDGVTGGFNFQAAWATGWTAGHSLAQPLPVS